MKDKALQDIIEIIEKNKGKRVFVMTDSLGKEELLVSLAEYFNTLVDWSYISFKLEFRLF